MKEHLRDALHTLVPRAGDKDGPLPPLMILGTVVTGLVDAFSYLELNRVFVANMTGNAVFLGFNLAGAAGFLWWAILLAIVGFLLGALLGGRITHAHGAHRGRHLQIAAATQVVLVLIATVIAFAVATPYWHGALAALVVALALGMGLQNATARALAVPDLTTTVLTLTMTGMAADSTAVGGPGSKIGRRLTSVLSMFGGALIGALLVVHDLGPWSLALATVILAVVAVLSTRLATSQEPWTAGKTAKK